MFRLRIVQQVDNDEMICLTQNLSIYVIREADRSRALEIYLKT